MCRVIRVILCLSKSRELYDDEGVIRLSLCKYESREIYLNNESKEDRNESWDVYLESVQYGLDYVLGMCKCLHVSDCLSVS